MKVKISQTEFSSNILVCQNLLRNRQGVIHKGRRCEPVCEGSREVSLLYVRSN